MPRKAKQHDIERLDDLRRTSGWYLAAWRQYKNLSQTDIALEAGMNKSAISELETGKPRKDGTIPRFNRDTIERMSAALGITGGMLLDVNPYKANAEWLELQERVQGLNEDSQARVLGVMRAVLDQERKVG